ncbi:MAG: hypothetical protein MPN21_17825 [Thermoanaerobaculia bacterium]|nr:hypothetical protein [Thermoanaerobaculia bacterium]
MIDTARRSIFGLDSSIAMIGLVVAVASIVGGASGYLAGAPSQGPPGNKGDRGDQGPPGQDAPLGTIVAWHPNAVTPPLPLPTGWHRCNGQTISLPPENPLADSNGVYQLPDLNGVSGDGSMRFLRGGSESGVLQPQDWKSFYVAGKELGTYTHGDVLIPKEGYNQTYPFGGKWEAHGAPPQQANRLYFKFDDSEVRPVNMSVVWIMKVAPSTASDTAN